MATLDISEKVKFSPGIRSMDMKGDGTLLVGTRGADVFELDNSGEISRTIVQGHF